MISKVRAVFRSNTLLIRIQYCYQFKKYFTLLLIGETGSGKTTLLDAFVNYLNAIEFTDNWRWKLVDENNLNHLSGGESKTSEMVTYYINDHQNKFF